MIILPNGVAVIETDTHHRRWIEETGKLVHDKFMADQLCRHLEKGSIVIEGGCNIGTLTFPMLEKGATVFAFDPNPDVEECLLKNCEQWKAELFFFTAGLSDRFGSTGLHQMVNAGASYLGPGQDAVFAITTTIDSHHFPRVDLIKLDIEGYEVKALKGARGTITHCHPVLILEVNRQALERAGDSDDALFAMVESLGYTWTIMQENCRRGDPQFDILCQPK